MGLLGFIRKVSKKGPRSRLFNRQPLSRQLRPRVVGKRTPIPPIVKAI